MTKITAYHLPEKALASTISKMQAEKVTSRILQNDYTLWQKEPGETTHPLGWLAAPKALNGQLRAIYRYADKIHGAGFKKIIMLGMGGAVMSAEVFSKVFGPAPGSPHFTILDTTNPETILKVENTLKLTETHFIVASKSGTTLETLSLMKYFYNKTADLLGQQKAGFHFTALTDPGSKLEKEALRLNFAHLFSGDPDTGGRYSALSCFGLMPAALLGLSLEALLQKTRIVSQELTKKSIEIEVENPAWLGAVLGACARHGQDKLSFCLAPPFEPLGPWLEQLVAESTGKNGQGILPITEESVDPENDDLANRLFIAIKLAGQNHHKDKTKQLIKAGLPVIIFELEEPHALAGELYRWMFAMAVAGWVLDLNPFDQPNVEASKAETSALVARYKNTGQLPAPQADYTGDKIEIYSGFKVGSLQEAWGLFLKEPAGCKKEGYIAIQAFLNPDRQTDALLAALQKKLKQKCQVAVTTGYGPRFLHSTGQLHKGDRGDGLFVQLTANPARDLSIPDIAGLKESALSFATLHAAQSLGDQKALARLGRKVIRFHFKKDQLSALKELTSAL